MLNPEAQLIDITRSAGEAILAVYNSEDFGIVAKEDDSPLTRADKASNNVITAGLEKISELPIISEENSIREAEGSFWLVDPLDGTKEFIKRNGEFTVNIALVEDSKPVLGVVYAPALGVAYYGDTRRKIAFKEADGMRQAIASRADEQSPVVVTSKSHKDERTAKFLGSIGRHQERSIGSSLKLCLVAEGAAMLYPRLGPTHIWDTAAADAVVRAAGGIVADTGGVLLDYTLNGSTLNPYFVVAASNCTINWRAELAH